MASLLISGAVNIGVGLLLNFLFPQKQPDVVQEGPRLTDLSVTSSAYGETIPIHYGTIRTSGNVIWSPGLEEVANTTRQEAGGGKGGGGGGSVTTTTYSYFASFAVGFAEGVAEDVLRIWGDGKLIYDKTGSGLAYGAVKFRFYPGNETQLPDALIEADKGVGNVPAHRGLCYIVFERMALANFGNRIPNITAEITYNALSNIPFTPLAEAAGLNPPGSVSGSDQTGHMYLDPFTDDLYFLKAGDGGLSRQSIGSMSTQVVYSDTNALSSASIWYGMNGKIYGQMGGANFQRFDEIDPITMQKTGFGFGFTTGLGGWGDPFDFPNSNSFLGVLRVGAPEIGVDYVDMFVISAHSILGNGGFVVVYPDATGTLVQDNHLDTDIGTGGPVIQDFHNKRCFVTQESTTQVDLYEVVADINIGLLGPSVDLPTVKLVGSYTKGGTHYAGTDDTTGWCIIPNESAMILSNGISMFKVDMDSGAVLATNLTLGFKSQDQYALYGLFGFGNGLAGPTVDGFLYTISTDDLTVLATQNVDDIALPDALESNYQRAAYDPRSHSLIFSRINASNPLTQRVVRVLLQRGTGQGVGLDTIVADLSTRAGLLGSDINVTGLAGEIVQGFSVTRQGAVRTAMEPLMRGFLFEGVESDYIMKFVRRGGASALTVDPNFLGRVGFSDTEEFVKEVRVQEVELPMRVAVRYSDRSVDYQQGTQTDKRVQNPVPSMYSGEELTLDLPIVYANATPAKQLAQRWLYTVWAERASIESALPWKYIRLDPTDIFEVTYRGDLRRLRMAQLEVGAGLDIDFRATQEDASSDLSGLTGTSGNGLIPQIIPSTLPTKWLPLDIPLLTAAEASAQAFNRAYYAVAGYEPTWPGMLLFQSRDLGQSYQEVGSATVAATWGRTKIAIPAAPTTFTWDDVTTIDVLVANGFANFTSSTDLEVLNGDNAIAVMGPNGPEIIQFVNVTAVDSTTVRLSRLLRGRRGTDIPELTDTHVIAEQVVLLELGTIYTFQNPLSLINVSVPFRPVTLHTALEDAPVLFQTFTGQDLLPYSVVSLAGAFDGSGNLPLTWIRRTRYNGELRDGTGTVPLNEVSEQYEIDIVKAGVVLNTYTATSPSLTYTAAQQAADGVVTGNTITARVYQISGAVGRGREASLTLTKP